MAAFCEQRSIRGVVLIARGCPFSSNLIAIPRSGARSSALTFVATAIGRAWPLLEGDKRTMSPGITSLHSLAAIDDHRMPDNEGGCV